MGKRKVRKQVASALQQVQEKGSIKVFARQLKKNRKAFGKLMRTAGKSDSKVTLQNYRVPIQVSAGGITRIFLPDGL